MFTSMIKKTFPNVRLAFHLTAEYIDDSSTTEEREVYTPYTAQLTIIRPTRLDTLASLLQYPVTWVDRDYSENHTIKGISSIHIDCQGTLIDPSGFEKEFTFRNLVNIFEVKTSNTQTGVLADSIKQLIHFVLVRPKDHDESRRNRETRGTVSQLYPAMKIRTESKEELDVWLANVRAVAPYPACLHR
jgi:hypothetical protein